ncbi:MAG: tRNA dihydrouridine synthase [Nanobdellota archaeon]
MKEELKIGTLTLDNPLILAPMEGVNSISFMKTCAIYGAGMVETQAIESVEDNFYDLKKLEQITIPVSFQLLTSDSKKALELIKQTEAYVNCFDLNCGCPLKRVLGEKKGGYLLTQPQKLRLLIRTIRQATTKPLTIKIRKGFDDKRINYLEIGLIAQEEGVDAVILHARTVRQGYSGKADWDSFKKLKKHLSIPVIANGDIAKPGHTKFLLEQHYADGIMIGRLARNNPGIFKTAQQALNSKPIDNPEAREYITVFRKHYLKEQKQTLNQYQDHICWLISETRQAKKLKQDIRKANNHKEVDAILQGAKLLYNKQ